MERFSSRRNIALSGGWFNAYQICTELSGRTHFFFRYRVRTTVILMKLCFATGVLAIPSAFSIIGYGPGVVLLVAWGAMTTCMILALVLERSKLTTSTDYAYVMYLFRMRYSGVHNIADAAAVLGGPIAREVAGALFLLTWMYGIAFAQSNYRLD